MCLGLGELVTLKKSMNIFNVLSSFNLCVIHLEIVTLIWNLGSNYLKKKKKNIVSIV